MMPGAAPGAQSAPPAFDGFKRPPNLRQSSPSLGDAATRRLRQGFASGGMGFRVSLQCSNPERLMSAMGQKRTSRLVRVMSALPPKADIHRRNSITEPVRSPGSTDLQNAGTPSRTGRRYSASACVSQKPMPIPPYISFAAVRCWRARSGSPERR